MKTIFGNEEKTLYKWLVQELKLLFFYNFEHVYKNSTKWEINLMVFNHKIGKNPCKKPCILIKKHDFKSNYDSFAFFHDKLCVLYNVKNERKTLTKHLVGVNM